MWMLVLSLIIGDAEPRTTVKYYESEAECIINGENVKDAWKSATKNKIGQTVYSCVWLPPCESKIESE